jgi:hypothetical protein
LFDYRAQGRNQLGAGPPQLVAVHVCEMVKYFRAARSDADAHLAPVRRSADPFDKTAFFEPVDEADGAMMSHEKLLGHPADGGSAGFVAGFDCEQKLMLLRLEAFGPCGLLAEVQEAADLEAKPV